MTQARTFNADLRHLTPVGNIYSDPASVALTVRHRLRSVGGDTAHVVVFVAKEQIFAPASTSKVVRWLGADAIIGTYTESARASEIAADVREWVKEAGR